MTSVMTLEPLVMTEHKPIAKELAWHAATYNAFKKQTNPKKHFMLVESKIVESFYKTDPESHIGYWSLFP